MGDAMKSLEKRTLDSKWEIDILAVLDEMKSMKICRLHVEEIDNLRKLLQGETSLRKAAEEEASNLYSQLTQWIEEAAGNSEILKPHKMLKDAAHQKEKLEG